MTAANDIGTVLEAYLGNAPPVHVRCWDGSSWVDPDPPRGLTDPKTGMFFVATKTYVTA
jgi:hypothetical protein